MIKLFTLPAVTLASSGVAQTITASTQDAICVVLEAPSTNTGNVYYGDSSVSTTSGLTLAPGRRVSIDATTDHRTGAQMHIADVFVVGTSGDVVRIAYQTRNN